MPLAKSATVEAPKSTLVTTTSSPDMSSVRLDIGGVPVDIFSAFDVPMTASEKEVAKLKTIADWAKIGLGLVLPLLTIAAIIETWVTPLLLLSAIK